MKFSENLRKLRIEHKMTQEDVAKAAGISTRIYQKYEAGKAKPRMDTALKLAEVLSVSTEELMGIEFKAAREIGEAHGSKAASDFMKYAETFSALMAGGEIPEEDRTAAFLMIASAYNQATTIAKQKYTPKRYRKPKNEKPVEE